MKSVTFSINVRKLIRNGGHFRHDSLMNVQKHEQCACFDGSGKLWYNEVQTTRETGEIKR